MNDLTPEDLAERIEALLRKLSGADRPKRDWRSVIGMFEDSELILQIDAAGRAIREADRQAAREAGVRQENGHVISP